MKQINYVEMKDNLICCKWFVPTRLLKKEDTEERKTRDVRLSVISKENLPDWKIIKLYSILKGVRGSISEMAIRETFCRTAEL